MADYTAIALDLMDGFNARDLERVTRHLHPGYEATWPHGHLPGADAMAHELGILAALPDLQMAVQRVTETDDGALVEVRAQGTHTGDWTAPDGERFPASGRSIDAPMALVMVFDGDQVRAERIYFDQQTLHDSLRPLTA
ncbi:MAG: ester cyclase [Acidimicrobiales bacterium]